MRTYRTRNPRNSPLWPYDQRHQATFVAPYLDTYELKYGPLRLAIAEVMENIHLLRHPRMWFRPGPLRPLPTRIPPDLLQAIAK